MGKNKKGKEYSDVEKYTPWLGEEFSGKLEYELNNKSPVRCYLNSQSGFGNRNNPADKPQHSRQL